MNVNVQGITEVAHSMMLGRFGRIEREEVNVTVEVSLMGELFHAIVQVSRYEASDETLGRVLTPWHGWLFRVMSVDRGDVDNLNGVGPARIEAIREAAVPAGIAWLESDEYAPSARRAMAYALKQAIGQERYNGGLMLELVFQHKDAIEEVDRAALEEACRHMIGMHEALDRVPFVDKGALVALASDYVPDANGRDARFTRTDDGEESNVEEALEAERG